MVTLRDLIRFGVSRAGKADAFFGHGTASAWDEMVYLCQHALGLPLDLLEPFLDARLLRDERQVVVDLLRRRVEERIPAAYLTGEAWLGDLRFRVDPRVIVPRSYIAEVLREDLEPLGIREDRVERVLDLCTGSGCLAIVAALRFLAARVDAVELSPDALAVARLNVADYGLDDRVSLFQGDLYKPLSQPLGQRSTERTYDLILTNPPYVDAPAMAALPAEYRHEPVGALAGGEDGLDLVRIILAQAPSHLAAGGHLVMEVGNSRDALEAAFPQLPFTWIETTAPVSSVCLLAREHLVPTAPPAARK
ncbi:MAG: 50S ribosomal protein L3 N(5)-glutamine methyltransferase, partial [bacterium]